MTCQLHRSTLKIYTISDWKDWERSHLSSQNQLYLQDHRELKVAFKLALNPMWQRSKVRRMALGNSHSYPQRLPTSGSRRIQHSQPLPWIWIALPWWLDNPRLTTWPPFSSWMVAQGNPQSNALWSGCVEATKWPQLRKPFQKAICLLMIYSQLQIRRTRKPLICYMSRFKASLHQSDQLHVVLDLQLVA